MPQKLPSAKPSAATLPDGIQIFRAGRHTDDAGTVHEFSEAALQEMATSYNPALREAPLTVGHPASNLPAYGWVKAVQSSNGVLTIDAHQVEPQFSEMVQAGRFKKRSASFYPPKPPTTRRPASGICAMLPSWARSRLQWPGSRTSSFLKTTQAAPSPFLNPLPPTRQHRSLYP